MFLKKQIPLAHYYGVDIERNLNVRISLRK